MIIDRHRFMMVIVNIVTTLCAHLLSFVLSQVRLKLEVGFEFAGTELALVGAVNHHYLFSVSLAFLTLDGLHLDVRVLIMYGLPLAALWIGPCCTVLALRWNVCNALYSVKNTDNCIWMFKLRWPDIVTCVSGLLFSLCLSVLLPCLPLRFALPWLFPSCFLLIGGYRHNFHCDW